MAYTKYCEKTRRQNKSPATPVRTGKKSPSITSVGVTRIQTPATNKHKLVILALTIINVYDINFKSNDLNSLHRQRGGRIILARGLDSTARGQQGLHKKH